MNQILGVFCRTAGGQPPDMAERLGTVAASWGGGAECRFSGAYGVVVASDGAHTGGPRPFVVSDSEAVFVAAGRLDNGPELCGTLNLPTSAGVRLPDGEVLRRAYEARGKECCTRMYGDWVFAAWHPDERRLVMARSHYGCINLYYHISDTVCAFATDRQALLALGLTPVELDELWLAQYLVSWHAYFGEGTPHRPVKILPPAHVLEVGPAGAAMERYWHPLDKPELKLADRREYTEAFRTIFDEAVRCRLRTERPVASMLSGGLDSGSVAVTAAGQLAARGGRLTAYTAVPAHNTEQYLPGERFGDELPFARAAAEYSGAIDLVPVVAGSLSPLEAIRKVLHLVDFPIHGAANLHWMLELQQTALAAGVGVLLTGAAGNGGFSWKGYVSSQPLRFQLEQGGWQGILTALAARARQSVKGMFPARVLSEIQLHRIDHDRWCRQSAIKPAFARRLQLLKRRLEDRTTTPRNPRDEQRLIVMPGRWVVGALNAEIGALSGLEVRDPTCDARLLDFVFTVPDRFFIDPATGLDRWLVRAAMEGRLPDQVRLNRRRGRQNADIVPRLRHWRGEMEATLDGLAGGPAAEYVDCGYLRQVWQRCLTEDTPEVRVMVNQVLLRGIMAGLFVNNFNGVQRT